MASDGVFGVDKQAWLENHFRCISCGAAGLRIEADRAVCKECEVPFERINNAVSFLTEDLRRDSGLFETENISYRNYDGNAEYILHHIGQKGGMILDCGSGQKNLAHEHLVQLEIVNYPNVDVLAVNQVLPFVDNSFDAIFSLDVLEHVNDPMASAKEIARVLKPGGILYIDLPFLQAEHGYPHHYFNATRAGLQELFKGFLESEAHIVPRSGHPMAAIHQILDIYSKNLPDSTAENFKNLTVGQILEFHQEQWITMPEFEELSEEGQWLIASTTQAVFRKPESAATEAAVMGWFKADHLPGFGKAQHVCETTKSSLDETMSPVRGAAWRWVDSGARHANRIFRSGAPNRLPVKSRLVDRLVARIVACLWRFNAEDYLNENPDVREAGMAPMDHWVKYGYLEQRRLR